MRRRAFSLVEVMVASSMALIIVAAATTTIIMLTRALNRTGQSSALVTEVQLLSEYLVAQVQGVGGGAIRPWMVTVLENNTGAGGSDVFTFGDVPSGTPGSTTITEHLGNGTYSLFVQTGGSRSRPVGFCGLAELRKDIDGDGFVEPNRNAANEAINTNAAFRLEELEGQQVILVSPSGDTWRSVVLSAAGLDTSREGCFVRFVGASGGLAANGAFTAADRIGKVGPSEDLEQWVFGQVAFVRARRWTLRQAQRGARGQLVETLTTKGTKERVLFEGVLDLQIAIGYDHEPFDGVLDESEDGRGDEWFNQQPGDTPALARLPQDLEPLGIGPELLRMVDIGVVLALPIAERTNTVRAFDGPERTGPEARLAGGRAYLRNLLLFL